MSINLTDAEIDDMCDGLTQNHAKVRYLTSLGLKVDRKPNGRPLVSRSHYEAVRGASRPGLGRAPARNEPNWGAKRA
jgi:hypothetical protein